MIVSFGYNHRQPPRAHKVFDVRDVPHQTQSPEYRAKMKEIAEYVQAHPHHTVAIGCKAGKHRSPSLANDCANLTRQSVLHRE